jgi:hypothetical protein
LRADAAVLGGLDDRMLDEIAAAATFRARRARVQRIQAERLAAALPLRQLRLPFLFSADLGRAEIGVLADALAEGIDRLPERDVA